VLVERIVRLVTEGENPPDLDRILVVTFTKAAAAEMKERIRKALQSLSADGGRRAAEQLALVSDAPISTIHSFCLSVLQENFHLAGLEPGFRTGDQAECTLMLSEAMDRLMDDCYGTDPLDPAMADLLDCFAGYRDDHLLRERIMEVWRFSRSMPWPDAWMETSAARLLIPDGSGFGETSWGQILLEQAEWMLDDLIRESERAGRLSGEAGFPGYEATFSGDADMLRNVRKSVAAGWDAAVSMAASSRFSVLKRAPKESDAVVKERLQAMRGKVKDGFEQLRRDCLSGLSEQLCQEIRSEYGRQAKLVSLVQSLDRIYGRMKRRKNLVDFDDMEHMCLKLLVEPDSERTAASAPGGCGRAAAVPTPLAEAMRERWHAVMIDEYQDSNLVQECLLGAVSTQDGTCGNLFMVGDVKQSIYRFRQAMPELFLEKYSSYPARAGEANRKILLHRNFRSRSQILDAVNFAFSRLMTARLGEMDYTGVEMLQPGAVYPEWQYKDGGPVEFHLIDTASGPQDAASGQQDTASDPQGTASDPQGTASRQQDADSPDESVPSGEGGPDVSIAGDPEPETVSVGELEHVQEEAAWAARSIRDMVCGMDGGESFRIAGNAGMRPVRYADCAILMRVTTGWSQVFVEEFALQGIPLFSDTGAGYFASAEVGVVLSLLQILDNPLQDIPLAAVLRSPIGQWDETAIAEVRQADPAGTLMDAVRKHGGTHAGACRSFLEQYEKWRNLSQSLSVGELLDRLYDETGYDLHVGALPQGSRRQANLRLLSERAARFEKTGYRGLFQFTRYLERLRAGKGDMDAARTIGEGEDVVRLMSIHKSKGLEYPVVLLCGAGKAFNVRDRQNRILLHHRYGFGPDGVLPEEGATWPTAAKRALQAVLLREMLSEEMRILYVALTRAKERLLICGRMAAPGDALEKMAELPVEGALPAGAVLTLRSQAAWLLAAWAPALRVKTGAIRFHVHSRMEIAAMRLLPKAAQADAVLSGAELRTAPVAAPDADAVRERLARNLAEAGRRLAWKTEHPALSSTPSKMTVTGLKRLWEEQDAEAAPPEDAFRIGCTAVELEQWDDEGSQDGMTDESFVLPEFMSRGKPAATPLRYGTLMHLVLQHLDPVDGGPPDVEETIGRLVGSGLIPESDRDIPDRASLRAFVDSPLFRRMINAGRINRETPFTVRMPAAALLRDPTIPAAEHVVMQGVVDCWFIEDNRIILIDYKTDHGFSRVPAYRRQLSWYAAAMEKISGLPVGEAILWFLHAGRAL
jgi:ATP-dependent helicase/nuclease subunit A